MYEIKFEFRSVGLCGGFLFVSLFAPFFTSLPAYFFIYLFLPFFIFYFFALSLCHSFYFFSIFLEPEPKLFHVTWVNKLHWHFIFYMVCNGKSKQYRQIPGFLGCSGAPGCSGMFRSVPECFGVPVFRCSGVPGFSTCHSFINYFWQCVTKSCKVTIACQTN